MRYRPCSRLPARAALVLLALSCGVAGAQPAPPRVVATIVPVHSLTAMVMEGVAEPALLLPGGVSPHTYALRPSELERLAAAELVVWVGSALERFLVRALAASARPDRRVLELMDAAGVHVLPARAAGVLAPGVPADEHDHGHGRDPHIWLDPDNAVAIVDAVARELSALDPHRASRYAANGAAAAARIRDLDVALTARLALVRHVPYVVFHDAYQAFERHFRLAPAAAVSVSPERAPGARRLVAIRERIQATGARCVFSEPQFEPRLVDTLIEGTGARRGVLDPVGSGLEPGPGAWPALMGGLADALVECLSGS